MAQLEIRTLTGEGADIIRPDVIVRPFIPKIISIETDEPLTVRGVDDRRRRLLGTRQPIEDCLFYKGYDDRGEAQQERDRWEDNFDMRYCRLQTTGGVFEKYLIINPQAIVFDGTIVTPNGVKPKHVQFTCQLERA